MRHAACIGSLAIVLFLVTGCGGAASSPTSTAGQESSTSDGRQRLLTGVEGNVSGRGTERAEVSLIVSP